MKTNENNRNSIKSWLPGSLLAIILHRSITNPPQAATGRHNPPRFWLQNPANLRKSVLPPAQECHIAHLGPLATPVEPKLHPGLAADTRGGQSPPKCDSNSSQICHKGSKKTSIQASKHPSIHASGPRGRRQRR